MHAGAGLLRRRRTAMATARKPPWKRPKPKDAKHHKLTPAQIAAARTRAKHAGRRYPNLVDNIWAARQPK
jgi:hypothetical protein